MPETQTGIELKLENGNVIKADNAEEALKVAAKMIEDNSKAYRETKASLDALQGQYGTLQQTVESLKPKPQSNGGFSNDTYFKLLNDDPIKAQNYIDAHRFGINSPDEVVPYITGQFEKISSLDGQTLAAGFVNMHPEFPQDADTAKTMTQRVVQLKNEGHPTTLTTMEMAYTQLVNEGKIKPLEMKEEEKEETPPSPGGSGGVLSDAELAKVEQMTTPQMQAYLKSKGLL